MIYVLADARADNRPALVTVDHLRRLLPYLPDFGSPALRRKLVEMVPHEGLQRMKAFVDTMHRRSVEIFREKQLALQRGDEAVMKQVGEGKDIMSILGSIPRSFILFFHSLICIFARAVKANASENPKQRLTDEEMMSQMATFLLAGTHLYLVPIRSEH